VGYVIPAHDTALADRVVSCTGIDVLLPVEPDTATTAFIERYLKLNMIGGVTVSFNGAVANSRTSVTLCVGSLRTRTTTRSPTSPSLILPDGITGPFVNSDFGDVAIATIAITGEGYTERELKDVADDFRKKLYQLTGISKVELFGVQDERVWLELDTRKLAAVGIQVNTLIKDLQGQNVVLPSGNINADGTRLLLETSGDFPSVHAIETMLTRVGSTDSLVRLADLVTVRRGYVSPKIKPIYFNGRPAVVLSVVMQPDQDVTQLGRKLRVAAREYEERLPIGFAIDFAAYQADQVRASVNSALSNVAQTFIVVAGLVVLFLGLRAGMVAAMIVPFAVMFSLIGMRALGIALEQVSIAAIIIALGLLVDNGVVIVEDIVSRIDRGMPAREAGLASGGQYAFPLLISSVTTIAAFLPPFLLSGSSGEYAFSLAAVVALTLGGSWIAALYILPALTVWFIGGGSASSKEDVLLHICSGFTPPRCALRSTYRLSCWPCASCWCCWR
jgi:multidrug efflux pump subunit AcrB